MAQVVPSSMQRVFGIAELVHMILSWLPYDTKTSILPSKRHFLSSIASVNVPFRDAVTTILWRGLKTFTPLLRLIPKKLGQFPDEPTVGIFSKIITLLTETRCRTQNLLPIGLAGGTTARSFNHSDLGKA
jgi:hypothetical protein